jgi:hypothetical protein
MMHSSAYVAMILAAPLAFCAIGIRKSQHMSASQSENSEARTRSLLWMEMLWEGANTTTREEKRKDEVLEVFHELARDSRSKQKVREYVPWEPLW